MTSTIKSNLARLSAETSAHIAASSASIRDTRAHIRASREAIESSLELLQDVASPGPRP